MEPDPRPSPRPTRWEDAPLEWPRATGHVDDLLAAVALRQRRRRRRLLAATGAALAVICLGVFTRTPLLRTPAVPPAAPRTVVVAPEHRTLPDGTVVELRPGADVSVHFTAGGSSHRRVTLIRGEALFHVAPDPARPFVVRAGGSDFRAVGTAFSVSFTTDSVVMLVTEGRVTVAPASAPATAPTDPASAPIVAAGFRAVVAHASTAAPTVAPVSDEEAQHALAWRVPRLEFSATPLREVVALLNVHSGRRLRLASADVGRMEVSGALRANNLEPLFHILRTSYRIEATADPDGTIVLRAAR